MRAAQAAVRYPPVALGVRLTSLAFPLGFQNALARTPERFVTAGLSGELWKAALRFIVSRRLTCGGAILTAIIGVIKNKAAV